MEVKTPAFRFKEFAIQQEHCSMKVGTDGVLLGAWADVTDATDILDIGTGSGVVAIMLAQRTTHAKIVGVEVSENDWKQAAGNMEDCIWSDRLEAIHNSIQDFAKTTRKTFNLIVSNPPFFSGGTFSDSQDRNSVRHTIKLPHGDLLMTARRLLAKDGKFCVVLPRLEGLRFMELAADYKLFATKMLEVYPKKDKPVERLLIQFEKQEKALKKSTLIIQKEARNDWTTDYIALTGDFYLKM